VDATIPAKDFDLFVSSPDGLWEPGLPIAAARAGAVGLLNLTYLTDPALAARQAERLTRLARGRHGLVLHGRLGAVERAALGALTAADTVLFTGADEAALREALDAGRRVARRVGLVVTSEEEARLGERLGFDLLAAKGHEAGGRVGEETTFILLQRLVSRVSLPVYAWGGVGLATAAACRAGGAAGVVLDWQLALTREAGLPASFRRRLARMDGSETAVVREPGGYFFRLYAPAGHPAREELHNLSERLSSVAGRPNKQYTAPRRNAGPVWLNRLF
jgi:NAD(P)H-dependent flavin oxidoreductase YrpB (nitropropane dioxygenase family)